MMGPSMIQFLFTPLSLANVTGIVDKNYCSIVSTIGKSRHSIIHYRRSPKKWIAEHSYEPAYGARPLRRFITREVETPLAKEIVAGRVLPKTKSDDRSVE